MSQARPDPLETWARETAARLGLPLQAPHLPGVVENLRRLAAQGERVMAHPLDETDEPAPVYRP